MDKSIRILFVFVFVVLAGYAQDSNDYKFNYEVVQVYKPLSVSKASLLNANTVEDLHRQYRDSWVKEYLSVEVSAKLNGKSKAISGKDQSLTEEQKQLMINADNGSEIDVVVNYIPDNSLKHNDAKKFDFSFMVNPEQDAAYIGGEEKLLQDIRANLIDIASWDSLRQHQLAVVRFVVDKDGRIIEPKVFWSSDDEQTDAKMIDFVCNMPAWAPAQYNSGKKIAQEYALTIGDNNSCVLPMLNTREY